MLQPQGEAVKVSISQEEIENYQKQLRESGMEKVLSMLSGMFGISKETQLAGHTNNLYT